MFVIFATSAGDVRRNKLSDFVRVMANGKIAMKLEPGEGELVGVRPCNEDDDILLATAGGKCIRFSVSDVRVFAGRTSTGVRGIRLAKDDKVISMSILRSGEAESVEERDAYLRYATARRRGENGPGENGGAEAANGDNGLQENGGELSPARLDELAAAEQFILSVADDGYGKRTSAYEYRLTGRGGQGIGNLELSRAGGREAGVVAAFPVAPGDQIMLVTDAGKLIRSPVEDIRIAGRTTRGVTLFRIDESERIVSVAHLPEEEASEVDDGTGGDDDTGGDDTGGGAGGPADAGPDEA
jgi:DNA gyrase subunit A